MRHASKAAAQIVAAAALAAAFVGPSAPGAEAIDSPGGTPAPVAAVATSGTGGTVYAPTPAKTPASPKSHVSTKPRPRKPAKPVKPKPKLAPKTPAPIAGVPTPAQTVAEGAVFPVLGAHSFGGPENRFGAPRNGYFHEGQDVLAEEGLQVVAPLAGAIIATSYQAGGAGWYAAEQTVDGLSFFYAHCQASSLAVSAGQTVKAGQAICKVGQTGDATAPHLHLEIWVGGWHGPGGYSIDPLPYLEAWEAAAG
jgi:murein DD-endopeptidase MepM/ murein hydrolase activator NlpD